MIKILTILLLCTASLKAFTDDGLLHSIALVENTPGPGHHGERSIYQLMPSTWRQYTSEPFNRAADPVFALNVARQHLAWVKGWLRRKGYPVTPYTVALVWKAGCGAVLAHRYAAADLDYATRVRNLTPR